MIALRAKALKRAFAAARPGKTLKSILLFSWNNFEEIICGVCLCAMSYCVGLQVLLRFFSDAVPWAGEVAAYSMVGAAYFGACLAIRDRAHIRISFFYNMMPPKWRLGVVIFADLLWVAFLLFFLSQSVLFVNLLFETVYISSGLGIDRKWPQSIVPLSLLLMIIRVGQVYWRWIENGAKGLPV